VTSAFRSGLEFLNEIGLYDVVLPFMLVFTLVFAILEKTRLFGEHEVNGKIIPKKNLNAIVAVTFGFLVIASTQIVAVINEVLANAALLLIMVVCFMLLAGALHADKGFSLEGKEPWMMIMMVIMFGGISLIFLNSLGWLQFALELLQNLDVEWVSSLVFFAIVIGLIMFITKDPKGSGKDASSN